MANPQTTQTQQPAQTQQQVQTNQPTQTQQPIDPNKKPKKWIIALLLSILVGSLGVDRFYMGYIVSGIFKLITLGGFGIWWLIDLILIATKYDFKKVQWVD
ncbi:NINE protein [Candidatus Pacearchaeota archaeon]|nr:NINE protein [Candidatus Pacearchaeota archaeon]MBD3283276.1 NINE protein [Candidatus Pacearchaeota archaeon]